MNSLECVLLVLSVFLLLVIAFILGRLEEIENRICDNEEEIAQLSLKMLELCEKEGDGNNESYRYIYNAKIYRND